MVQGLIIRRGHKPSLTLDLAMRICAGRRDGLSVTSAAAEQGVYQQLVSWWKRRGEELDMREDTEFDQLDKQDQIYVLFARGLLKAMAACEREWVEYWREAGRGDWRSAAKFLEHYDPETWAPRKQLTIRVERLEMQLLESYQDRWADRQQDGGKGWMPPELIINMLRQFRELGMMTRRQADLTKELEQQAAERGWRLTASILPAGTEPTYLDDADDRQPPARTAAIEAAPDTTAAEPEAAQPREQKLLELARHLCEQGRHVGRRDRRQTCIAGCGYYRSAGLPLVEDLAG